MSRLRETRKETLARVSKQQRYLIQILCDAYNSPKEKGKLYEMLRYYCDSQSRGSDMVKQLTSIQEKFARKSGCHDDRVKELEKAIADQDAAYAKLEQQLVEYNKQAKEYEDMLARNEKEKAELLASFQRHAKGSQSDVSDASSRSLELRAERLTAECDRMKKQSQDARDLCHQIQNELDRSNEECKTLERQIHAAKEQLSGSSSRALDEEALNRQIKEQESVIESLIKEIDGSNEEIAKLKRENQSLRDRLLHSE